MELQRKEEEKKKFKSGVATFYDEFSGQWEHIYESDHIHHGFYDPNSTEPLDHHSARIRMLEEAIRFANISGMILAKSSQDLIVSLLLIISPNSFIFLSKFLHIYFNI